MSDWYDSEPPQWLTRINPAPLLTLAWRLRPSRVLAVLKAQRAYRLVCADCRGRWHG